MRLHLLAAGLLVLGCDDSPAGTDPDTPPRAPSALAAYRLTGGPVALGWDPAPGALRHEVERTRDATGEVLIIGDLAANARSLVDSGTVADEGYTYRVRAANAAGAGFPAVIGIETAGAGTDTQVQPLLQQLGRNGKQAFRATVNGSANQLLTWVVLEGTFGGAVSATGTYRAPLRTGRFHLLALSADMVAGLATIDVN
jgi:hypothetical protein